MRLQFEPNLPHDMPGLVRQLTVLHRDTAQLVNTLAEDAREEVSAFDYMTEAQIGDVTARTYAIDVTAALVAAGDAVTAAGGGELVLPAGGYRISGQWLVAGSNLRIRGRGRKATVIRQYAPATPAIRFNGSYCELSGLTVDYPVQGTAGGIGIYSLGQYNGFDNFEVIRAYTGFYQSGGVATRINNFFLSNYTHTGLGLESTIDLFINSFVIAGLTTATNGIFLKGQIEALNISSGDVIFNTYPLNVEAPDFVLGNRLSPTYNSFTNVYFDSASQSARIFRMVETDFIGCWFSGGRSGVGFSGFEVVESHNIRFTGGKAVSCGSHGGIVRQSSRFITFSNFGANNNSVTSGSGVASGLAFEAGTTDFSVIGGTAVNNLPGAQQGYGVVVVAGTSNRYIIHGVNLTGNLTGALLDGGTGATKSIFGNVW